MVSGGTVNGDLSSLLGLFNSFTGELSGLSGSWQGLSHDNLISKSETFVSEATGGITGQMESFASACDLYQEYTSTKQALSNAQTNYNRAVANKESRYVTTYGNEIATYQTKLANLKKQIESLLASANSFHYAGAAASNTLTTTDTASLGTPSFGSLTTQTFTSSNNITLKYLLYIPNYGKEVSGLPVHMYMTGAGMNSTGEHIMTDGGIGKLLNEKNINPSGIVIVPYVPSGYEYEDEKFRKALAELPVAVCKDYNGDTNRISLSGHSYGAITAYNLVNENPNTFSAIVPVSGSKEPTEAFKNVKVWAFHGAQDNPGNNTDYKKAVKNIQAIQNMGGEATLHSYTEYPNCYHTHTGNYTFSNTFEDPDDDKDENISPLEWAFQQNKNESAA